MSMKNVGSTKTCKCTTSQLMKIDPKDFTANNGLISTNDIEDKSESSKSREGTLQSNEDDRIQTKYAQDRATRNSWCKLHVIMKTIQRCLRQ